MSAPGWRERGSLLVPDYDPIFDSYPQPRKGQGTAVKKGQAKRLNPRRANGRT